MQVVARLTAENVPAEQVAHVVAPAVGAYLPGTQSVHVLAALTDENVPAEQLVQVEEPVVDA